MRRFKSVIIFFAAVFLFSGCDWLRSTVGMPTSQDLARMETELRMKRTADSLDALMNDTLPKSDSIVKTDSVPKPLTKPSTSVVPNSTATPPTTVQKKAEVIAPKVASSQLTARYYVIVGSFKDDANAAKMDSYLLKNGYKPIRLEFKNGYKVVSSGAFSDANEAYTATRKLLQLEFSPEDIWVYDINQKLHIK
ncbi:MAG: hypothetical protein ACD_77C00325G0004 [uncultured bacterium]|nr:MAG: hypothetical protein ACD_77C00325G0004 [uncultured bacterium]HBY01044.1 hypothetical protein [Rikenellaceae bacterium]